MSLALVLLVFATAKLLAPVLQAVILWLGARWCSIAEVGYGRALLTCIASTVICLATSLAQNAAQLAVEEQIRNGMGSRWLTFQAAMPHAFFCLQLLLVWPCAKWLLRAGWIPAAMATVLMFLGGYACNLPLHAGEEAMAGVYPVESDCMAPTACGPHLSIPCKNCGLEHEVSMSGLAWSTLRARLLRPVHCPNCGYELPLPTDVPLQREDQLLVDKLVRPQRWDLVMFQPADRPARKAGGVVQRLVGLPGEKVEILAGGVFINGHRLLVAPSEAADKWVLVHDTLHTPTRPVPDGPKWQAAESPSVWKWSGGKWIFHSAKTATGSLAFSGRIADTHPYDATDPARLPALDENAPLVGDVRLETTLESVSGSGTLTFEWQYRGQRAQATIAVSGKATLRVSEFAEENFAVESASQTVPADVPGGLFTTNRVGLAVRNGYAFLLYGGSVLASLPLGGDDPQAAKSRQRRFSGPCRLGIVAAHCSLTLARILLYRDVYYRNPEEMSGIPAQRAVGLAEHPVTLENDAWYLLGDDSTCTGDSRFTGPVRSDALVGIARWIFWPPERWRQFH